MCSIIPVHLLSVADLRELGNNLVPAARHDRQRLDPTKASLVIHGALVEPLPAQPPGSGSGNPATPSPLTTRKEGPDA